MLNLTLSQSIVLARKNLLGDAKKTVGVYEITKIMNENLSSSIKDKRFS